jgi:PAS domain-containing protein
MTPSTPSNFLPEAEAAERLRQHLEEIARERDRAHRALQEREAELARIQRIGRVGGVEVDFRYGFKNRRSPEYLIIHGLPPDATHETHEDWVNRIHPDDRERTVKQFLNALRGRDEDYSATYRIMRPSDGQTRWVDVIAKIERDASGRALRLVGAHIDIT